MGCMLLSPLLYINALPSILSPEDSSIVLYADDTMRPDLVVSAPSTGCCEVKSIPLGSKRRMHV